MKRDFVHVRGGGGCALVNKGFVDVNREFVFVYVNVIEHFLTCCNDC